MLPIINIFNFDISTYAACFLIGIIFVFLLIVYVKKFFTVNILDAICCFPYWLIFFFIGAKLFYIMENIDLFFNEYYQISSSGFSFTGGILGGFLGIFLYCKQYKIKFKNLSQMYVIAFPLIYSFGKIGCFLGGCCNSKYNIPLQLLEALTSFIITLYILFNIKDKSILYKYLMSYSISRFVFDFLRENRKILFINLSFTQLICTLIVILSVWKYFTSKKYIKYLSDFSN